MKPRANPKKAVRAAMPMPINGVRPMTLAMWAALEHIDSPLITGREVKDSLELLPSLYLLTHDPREIFRGNLVDLAMQWADTVPTTALADIRAAAERQMRVVADVIPEDDEERAKKKTTVRSHASSRSPAANSTGATMKRSTLRRSQSSRSSTVAPLSKPTESSRSKR